jgi:hypothetical protein
VKTAIAVATLLFASILRAGQAHVFPFAPTTATPIEVHYVSGCHAGSHSVVREGDEITITAIDPQCVAVSPIPFVEKVNLPPVPMGVYRVTIREEQQFLATMEVVVRYAGPKPFVLHPSAMDPNDELPVRMSGVTCAKADCSDVTVRVGGEPVAITVAHDGANDGAIWFTAPPHEPGLVDVTVQQGDVIAVSPGALYYVRNDDITANEPILFPVIASANGAFGSRWRAVATVSNPSPWPVQARYTLHNIGPCILPCDPPFEPRSFEQFQDGYPHGTVMWVPRSEAGSLALSLRIRDVSRQEQGYGTEIPVVRERDFFHGRNIQLLDVPLDPRYRVKVRVYMVDPVLAPSLTGAVRIRRGDALLDLPFTFEAARHDLVITPYYAEVDLPQGAAGERVNVQVTMPLDATGWAFAAVTNNETQQVTIVAPQ